MNLHNKAHQFAPVGTWAASQGVQSLVQQGVSRKDIEAVSDLLFEAVVGKLSQAAS
ncbi:hypothetical protein [Nitrincola sp.]|uniref:hypothetical protein n=1 Tax=Nitrincola sp. TaxID=1926584 RepID=UPI003A8EABB1